MGHMLNNTIQDILIRKARLQGFNACWIPGTDHASIATEAKVVNKLKSQGINKSDLLSKFNDFKKLFANEITSKSPIELDIPNNSTPN